MTDRQIKEYKSGKLVKEYPGDLYAVEKINDHTDRHGQHASHKTKYFEWTRNYWRPTMAVLYGIILFIDFVARPIFNTVYAEKFSLAKTVHAIKELDTTVQIQAMDIASRNELIPQITTQEVHWVFMVLLGVSAWTRGMEKANAPGQSPSKQPSRAIPSVSNKREEEDGGEY